MESKDTFGKIKQIVQQVSYIKKSIVFKLEQLKHIYADMVKMNNNKKIFLICLESFHFQYKVFNVELDNLERVYLLLTNRAYYDYSCTYGLLHKLYEEYGVSVPTKQAHKPYKDLEPFAEYDLEDIYLVHDNAVELLDGLKARFAENSDIITTYKTKLLTGIHILSFVKTLEYDNNVLHDRIQLYDSYFQFYYDSQLKYFSGLLAKLKAFMAQIDSEIRIPEEATIEESDTITQVSEDACIVQMKLEEPTVLKEEPNVQEPVVQMQMQIEEPVVLSLTVAELHNQPVELGEAITTIQKHLDHETISSDSGSDAIENAIQVIHPDDTTTKKVRKRRNEA